MGVRVARGESAVSVPLRRLFRYEWTDVIEDWDMRGVVTVPALKSC
jgi:hypothetical protein